MFRYITGRLLGLLPVLLGVTVLVFLMLRIAPGDPLIAMLGEDSRGISRESLEELREQYDLDSDPIRQYFTFLGGVVQGDLGKSVRTKQPVVREIGSRLPATLLLAGTGMLIAVTLGLGLGVLAAVYRRTFIDYLAVFLALAGVSVPVFWSGLILMLYFSLELGWLPASGYGTWRHLVLPATAIGFASSAIIARVTRSSMIEVLRSDYVRTARAKGVHERRINLRHALRNAMLPIVTVVGLQFGGLLGGSVLTETVFAWPGIGRLVVDSIRAQDGPLVQGTVLFIAVVFIVMNLLVDLSYALLNPRIRYG
ncbi:MAG TPA: nickel ABC transporter permease [Deinococcales bacterium]|nr:nickel ABC transporter permease [Deinococcales bacterium]